MVWETSLTEMRTTRQTGATLVSQAPTGHPLQMSRILLTRGCMTGLRTYPACRVKSIGRMRF